MYQTARAFITRVLFIFYTLESSFIVSRAASFLSASFRLNELPRTAEKNTVMTILCWIYVYHRQILRRVKMGIHELHHKRGERLYCHCENSTCGRFLSSANISPHCVSSNVGRKYKIRYMSYFNISHSLIMRFNLRQRRDTKLSPLIT